MFRIWLLIFVVSAQVGNAIEPTKEQLAAMFKEGESQRPGLRLRLIATVDRAQTRLDLAKRGKYFVKDANRKPGFYYESDVTAEFSSRADEERGIAEAQAEYNRVKKIMADITDPRIPVVPFIRDRWLNVGAIGRLPFAINLSDIRSPTEAVALVSLQENKPGELALVKRLDLKGTAPRDNFSVENPVIVIGKTKVDGAFNGQEAFVIEAFDVSGYIEQEKARAKAEKAAKDAEFSRLLKQFDKDGDGQLSDYELEAAKKGKPAPKR